jgi:hypothetical protein
MRHRYNSPDDIPAIVLEKDDHIEASKLWRRPKCGFPYSNEKNHGPHPDWLKILFVASKVAHDLKKPQMLSGIFGLP